MADIPHRRLNGGPALSQKPANQQRDVIAPLAQSGELHSGNADAIQQVGAESLSCDICGQVVMGRCDDAQIDTARCRFSEARDFSFLKDAQETGLHVHRDVADLVQKYRAAIGRFEYAAIVCHRPREGALFVPEKLTAQQRVGESGAIDRNKRRFPATAQQVDRLGDELFAGTRLSFDEHRRIDCGELPDLLLDGAHGRTFAYQTVKLGFFIECAPQVVHFRQIVKKENLAVRIARIVLHVDFHPVVSA